MKDRSYSVSELSRYLSGLFSEDYLLRNLTVSGEISNLKYHSSGNIFFTLKDSASQLSAVLFAGDRAGLRFRLEDGMKVLCSGRVSVYEKGGSYQLYVKSVCSDGLGELYLLYEELKRKLAEMGFFDPAYKRALPRYARRIGIVTAKTGAAVRDIIQIARRRNPYAELWLYPAKVQGEGAAESISEGIEALDRLGLDVLIVGRGGGSIEDLWAFNEERVAEAIFHADTPIISAVGHETDTTIADYVADRRAPTPSAAAELAVFELSSFYEDLKQRESTFLSIMREKLLKERQSAERREYRLRSLSPETKLLRLRQRLMGGAQKADEGEDPRGENETSGLSRTFRLDGEEAFRGKAEARASHGALGCGLSRQKARGRMVLSLGGRREEDSLGIGYPPRKPAGEPNRGWKNHKPGGDGGGKRGTGKGRFCPGTAWGRRGIFRRRAIEPLWGFSRKAGAVPGGHPSYVRKIFDKIKEV